MENPYDQILIVVGHSNLFGRRVAREELIECIAPYAASQWLELCAKVEGFLSVKRKDPSDPQSYLAQTLFPPSVLDRVRRNSEKKVVLFSLGQLNVLRKFAIVYGRNDGDETELDMQKVSLSKAFLAAQDIHNDYDEIMGREGDLESFCQFIIRNGYLNGSLNAADLFVRAHQMHALHGQNVQFRESESFADFFSKTVGLTIDQAMALCFSLASNYFQDKNTLITQTTIINPATYYENLIIDSRLTDSIIENLVIDFSEAKVKITEELAESKHTNTPIGYNLGLFRKAPFIRLSNGKLVCANFSCLLEKTTQNMIWLPRNRALGLDDDQTKKLMIELTSYRGRLFEEHVKSLCHEMAKKNPKTSFYYIPPEATKKHEEIGDSLLVQGDSLVILEAKSRQFNEIFKYTGEWSADKQFIDELTKKAVEQIETAAQKILKGEVDGLLENPDSIKKIYPVIVIYEPAPMHGKMQRYIRQQVKEYGHLTDPIFAPLEIIYVGDLENAIDGIESYTVIDILEAKDSNDPHASETNFNNFYSYFVTTKGVLSNGWGKESFTEFWQKVFAPNFIFKSPPLK